MDLLLGLDFGTSSFKFGLFDAAGEPVGSARVAVEKDGGAGGKSELPVERFWEALGRGIAAALAEAGASPAAIRAISYGSQCNTFLLLDGAQRPLTPLILWSDLRAAPLEEELRRFLERDEVLEQTGARLPTPELATAKLRWIQRRQPDLWRRAWAVRTLPEYFVESLTGEPAGDEGTASLLGLWSIPERQWWEEALEFLELDSRLLGSPFPAGTLIGSVVADASEMIGLPEGIPLVIGGMDHHLAALGAGAGRLAPVSVSLGTALAAVRRSNAYRPRAGICVGPGFGEGFHEMAFSGFGAEAIEAWRRRYAADISIGELNARATGVPAGAAGLRAALNGPGSVEPVGFSGSAPDQHVGHSLKALYEASALDLAGLLARLCGERPEALVATGGGARSDPWLEIIAALLACPVIRPAAREPVCLGAAMLAARAIGWCGDLDEAAARMVRAERVFEPDRRAAEFYRAWKKSARGH